MALVNTNLYDFIKGDQVSVVDGVIVIGPLTPESGLLVNPMTTLGDLMYGGADGAVTRLVGNITTNKQFLSQVGDGSASASPIWATIASGDVTGMVETLSTGIILGGLISINGGDNTKFDISAGTGYVVDHTVTPATIQIVSWGAFTTQSVTNLATSFATDIAINISGNIVQQNFYSTEELRSLIFLGGLDHSNNTNILNAFPVQRPANAPASNIAELARALGDINLSGNLYSANGINLNLDKSSGLVYSYGRNNVNNKNNPSEITTSVQTALSFGYVFNNGSGIGSFTALTTSINPDSFDNGSGTLATVQNNKWTIQRILFFANSQKTFIQYGTTEYNQKSDAVAAVATSSFVALAGIRTAMVRGYIIVKQGETDLTSANTEFIEANRLGLVSGSGGGAGIYTFSNGLTNTITDVKLGGALTEATTIGDGTNGKLLMDWTTATKVATLQVGTGSGSAIFSMETDGSSPSTTLTLQPLSPVNNIYNVLTVNAAGIGSNGYGTAIRFGTGDSTTGALRYGTLSHEFVLQSPATSDWKWTAYQNGVSKDVMKLGATALTIMDDNANGSGIRLNYANNTSYSSITAAHDGGIQYSSKGTKIYSHYFTQDSPGSENTFIRLVQGSTVGAASPPIGFYYQGGVLTGLTEGEQVIDVHWKLDRIIQRNPGIVANQRAFIVDSPTYSFTSASTITKAVTVSISNAPTAGTNATINESYALDIVAGAVRLGAINTDSSPTALLTRDATTGEIKTTPIALQKAVVNVAGGATLRGIGTTPVTLIAAPGANKFINVISISFSYNYVTAAYNFSASIIEFKIGNSVVTLAASSFIGGADLNRTMGGVGNPTNNTALTLTTDDSSNATTGDGDLDVTILYTIEDANV